MLHGAAKKPPKTNKQTKKTWVVKTFPPGASGWELGGEIAESLTLTPAPCLPKGLPGPPCCVGKFLQVQSMMGSNPAIVHGVPQ